MAANELTAAQVIEQVRARGHDLTLDALKRMHVAKVVERPRVDHLGRGRGTRSMYVPTTVEVVVAIVEADAGRSLRERAWVAWWGGAPVPMDTVRTDLGSVAVALDEGRRILTGWIDAEDAGDETKIDELLEAVQHGRMEPGMLGRMRRRVRRAGFSTVTYGMLLVGTGRFRLDGDEGWISEFARAASLDRAMSDGLEDVPPWLPRDFARDLEDLARLIEAHTFESLLHEASDADLEEACWRAQLMVGVLPKLAREVEQAHGRGAFGMLVLASLDTASSLRHTQRSMVLVMLLFARGDLQPGMDELMDFLERRKFG